GAQRGCHCPGRNLLLLQGGGERGGPVGAAFRKRRLRALPGNHSRSGGWIVVVGGKQRRIDAHAGAAGRGVNGDVEHRSRGVGRVGALVGGERAVGVAQQAGRDVAVGKLGAKPAGEGEGDVFFRELVGKRGAALVAAVRGVDDDQVASAG